MFEGAERCGFFGTFLFFVLAPFVCTVMTVMFYFCQMMKKQTSKMILDVSKRLMKKYAFYFFIFNAINLNSFVSFYYLRTTCGVKGGPLITWGLTLQN